MSVDLINLVAQRFGGWRRSFGDASSQVEASRRFRLVTCSGRVEGRCGAQAAMLRESRGPDEEHGERTRRRFERGHCFDDGSRWPDGAVEGCKRRGAGDRRRLQVTHMLQIVEALSIIIRARRRSACRVTKTTKYYIAGSMNSRVRKPRLT